MLKSNENALSVASIDGKNQKNYACSLQAYENQNTNYTNAWDMSNIYPCNNNELSLLKSNLNYITSFIENNLQLNKTCNNKMQLKTGIKVFNYNLKNCIILYYNERMSLVYSKDYECLAILELVDVCKDYDIDENKQYHYKGLYMGFCRLVNLYPLKSHVASDVVNEYFIGLSDAKQNYECYLKTGIC